MPNFQAANGGVKVLSAGGTFFGSPDNPRIVRVYSQPTEIVPFGVVLLLKNKDRPAASSRGPAALTDAGVGPKG